MAVANVLPDLSTPVEDPAAWRGEQIAQQTDWMITLEPAQVTALKALLDDARAQGREPGVVVADRPPLPSVLGPIRDRVLGAMEGGRGFAVLRGLPFEGLDEDTSRLLFWDFGQYLGDPERQDAAGNLLHDVRNTGTRFGETRTVRYYQTDQEITFHNDGADIFLLGCRHQAPAGGRSRLVSAIEAFNEVARRRPDLAVVLQQDYWQDTRGQGRDGRMFQVMPVYFRHHRHLSANYKHQLILSAQSFSEVPRLTAAQKEAVDLLDAVCNEPGMALEFDLCPGDVLIANNYVTFHARTAFEDAAGDAPRRHMLRLWLTIPNGRPLPDVFADTREFGFTYERRMPAREA